MECKVKGALGSITVNKASAGDRIPIELFQIVKMMLWKCFTQYASKFGKVSSGHKTRKRSVFIPIPKKGNAKECSNYCTIALISHASKVTLKPGFKSTWTMNFQIFKLDLEKAEEPEIKISISDGSYKKQESSRKTSTSALFTIPKPLTVWITTNCGKFLKRW